ncbi:hypothetical protein SAY86_015227 [Trapa natans]|uniref:RAB6-interacting golgin n=1 Tax=Trapa natans TaxID=22666 RepID=A0AAN7QGS8_TRANT|nr:hypothetical protein SAY86_015227 [Trapa natans]
MESGDQPQPLPPPPLPPPHPQAQPPRQQLSQHLSGSLSFSSHLSTEDEDLSKSAIFSYRAKEEEIEKRKKEVRERVISQLGRIEEETKRLALIREELEMLGDPMRKEVAVVRKKIDAVNKELKPLGQICHKKEREYKEALETFNHKNKEKVQLINKLMEVCFCALQYPEGDLFNSIFLSLNRVGFAAAGERKREIEDEETGGAEQTLRIHTMRGENGDLAGRR